MADIVIVAAVGAAVAGILWKKVKDYQSGKGGCSCGGCSGCGGHGACGGCASRGARQK